MFPSFGFVCIQIVFGMFSGLPSCKNVVTPTKNNVFKGEQFIGLVAFVDYLLRISLDIHAG